MGTFLGLILIGMLMSALVFDMTQRLGSNDPFAIELACWWIFTDLVIMTKLRSWNLASAPAFVRQHPEIVVNLLIAIGLIVVLASVMLTRLNEQRQFTVMDSLARKGIVGYMLRTNLARGLVSMYCSLHLALFLA